MNEKKARLLVLVPHRDARLPLRAWSADLFSAGVPGAWSFPWAAPLAELKRPASRDELKCLAKNMRHCIDEHGGKVMAGPPETCPLFFNLDGKKLPVFGPSLPMELSGDFFYSITEIIIRRIKPIVIGSAIMPIFNSSSSISHLPPPPHITFRAAALANMEFYENDGCFFEWKIGPLHWLPKKNREKDISL